jgi:hypothetical protein
VVIIINNINSDYRGVDYIIIMDNIGSGKLCGRKERKEERKEENKGTFKSGISSMKIGRSKVKKKEDKEDTLSNTREVIYLRKPELEARPGPPAPSAESWQSLSMSTAAPTTTSLFTLCRSKGTSQGGFVSLSFVSGE